MAEHFDGKRVVDKDPVDLSVGMAYEQALSARRPTDGLGERDGRLEYPLALLHAREGVEHELFLRADKEVVGHRYQGGAIDGQGKALAGTRSPGRRWGVFRRQIIDEDGARELDDEPVLRRGDVAMSAGREVWRRICQMAARRPVTACGATSPHDARLAPSSQPTAFTAYTYSAHPPRHAARRAVSQSPHIGSAHAPLPAVGHRSQPPRCPNKWDAAHLVDSHLAHIVHAPNAQPLFTEHVVHDNVRHQVAVCIALTVEPVDRREH
eukprot:scaffold167813_cov30-Tisochrysis_lutea.AAC.3